MTEREKIRHLYNRAAFGLSAGDLHRDHLQTSISDLFKTSSYNKLETVTLAEVEQAKAMMKSGTKEEVKDLKQLLKKNVFNLNHLWLNEMIKSEAQLREKMSLFWHGHFACRSANPFFDQQYLDVIRRNALGNFGDMLMEVSKTPAMLQFLNNQQNKKMHPNENFAREVMELFTLGRGNYTEEDIKEAARAFTGFGFDMTGQFKFRVQQHDYGTKTFSGQTGDFSGEDILVMILKKKQCAYFITKKIYKYFVNENADEGIVQQLADKFYQSGYEIEPLMKEIFSSDWFYDPKNIGIKIKSPIELIAGLFRLVPTTFENDQSVVFMERALGQILLNPPNVAGWPGGRTWIDSSSLLFRMRMPQVIYYDKDLDFSPKEETPEMSMKMKMADEFIKKMVSNKLSAQTDWSGLQKYFSKTSNAAEDVANAILSRTVSADVIKCIRKNSDSSSIENAIKSSAIDVFSLPEYQLC